MIDIDEGNLVGATPLMPASGFGYSRIVMILLSEGANVSAVNGDGISLLHLAARKGHVAVTKLLVKAAPTCKQPVATHTAAHGCGERALRGYESAGGGRSKPQ